MKKKFTKLNRRKRRPFARRKNKNLPNLRLSECEYLNRNKISLITAYYNEPSEFHKKEIDLSILKNIYNSWIDRVVLLTHNAIPPKEISSHPKVTCLSYEERFNLKHATKIANETMQGELVIVTNSDIYFDHTLEVAHKVNFNNLLLCLTRKDLVDGNIIEGRDINLNGDIFKTISVKNGIIYCAGADAWMFKPPIAFQDDIILGTNHCDHLIVFNARTAGLQVLNAYRYINAIHIHKDIFRPDRHKYQMKDKDVQILRGVRQLPWK